MKEHTGGESDKFRVKPQAYHPLLEWRTVHLEWLYRFIKLAKVKRSLGLLQLMKMKLKSKHRKTKQNNIAAILRFFFVSFSSVVKALKFAFSFT